MENNNKRRAFLKKAGIGSMLVAASSYIGLGKFMPEKLTAKRTSKIQVKPNPLAVRRTQGDRGNE